MRADVCSLQLPAERFTLHQLPWHAAAGPSADAGQNPPRLCVSPTFFRVSNPACDTAAQVYRFFAEELARELPGGSSVRPTVLKAKKQGVNTHNEQHLKNLNTRDGKEIVRLTSVDDQEDLEEFSSQGHSDRYAHICRQFFAKDCPAVRHFEFAEGAQVCAMEEFRSCSNVHMRAHISL